MQSNAVQKINDDLYRVDFYKFTLQEVCSSLQESKNDGAVWWLNNVNFFCDFLEKGILNVTSSGTTGPRKEMSFSNEQVEYSASLSLSFFNLNPGDEVYSPLSSDFVAGKMMWLRAKCGRLVLWIAKPAADILSIVPKDQGFVFTPMVPYQLMETYTKQGADFARLGKVLLGGGAISQVHIELLEEIKNEVYQSFGMSETLTHVAMRSLKGVESFDEPYRAIGGYRFSTDKDKCLSIHNVLGSSESLTTNDVVDLFSNSSFIWKGRKDNVINSAGLKLHPEELESKLNAILVPGEFVISSVPSLEFEQQVVLVSEGSEVSLEDRNKIAALLANYERPRAYLSLPSFPRTFNGKLQRKKIRELIA